MSEKPEDSVPGRILARLGELGWSQRELGRRADVPDSTLRNILKGNTDSARGKTIEKLAAALGMSEQRLLTGKEAGPEDARGSNRPAGKSEVRLADRSYPATYDLPVDLPVLGTAAGSAIGSFALTGDVVDYVRRPYALLNAKDAYAVFVEGDSMEPRFEAGDLVFVHPHRKALPGDYVVVQEPDTNNGAAQHFIKRLVRVTGTMLKTKQYNPPGNLDFIIRPGLTWHKVMTDKDLYGI